MDGIFVCSENVELLAYGYDVDKSYHKCDNKSPDGHLCGIHLDAHTRKYEGHSLRDGQSWSFLEWQVRHYQIYTHTCR